MQREEKNKGSGIISKKEAIKKIEIKSSGVG